MITKQQRIEEDKANELDDINEDKKPITIIDVKEVDENLVKELVEW